MEYLRYLQQRVQFYLADKYLMPKRSHDELGIVHELFKLALFLLGDMSGRRIVSVLNDISVSFDSQIAEFVFKIAYLVGPKELLEVVNTTASVQ